MVYPHVNKRSKRNRKALFLATITVSMLVAGIYSPGLPAATRHLNWRQPQQIVTLKSLPVGDVPGHVISVGESRGRALFTNGEVATVSFKYLADYTRGTGPFRAYSRITFKDQSRIYARYRAFTTATTDGGSSFRGKFIFTKGTGRFRGIRGGGDCAGGRRVVHAQGAELYLNNFATYSQVR